MTDRVLSAFIGGYISSQPTPVVEFRLAGRRADPAGHRFLQARCGAAEAFAKAKTITNSLQTNGTLISDEWCRFLKRHHFMVGISLMARGQSTTVTARTARAGAPSSR